MRQQLLFENSLKDFASNRHADDGSVVLGVYDWSSYCATPILRGLSSLKGNVKHPDKYGGYMEDK